MWEKVRWGREKLWGRCGKVLWGVGEGVEKWEEWENIGEVWESVLGVGESEKSYGKVCWGLGKVRGNLGRGVEV